MASNFCWGTHIGLNWPNPAFLLSPTLMDNWKKSSEDGILIQPLQLPKPMPIYPILTDQDEEKPLDLSLTSFRLQSVIQSTDTQISSPRSRGFLPTCNHPNILVISESETNFAGEPKKGPFPSFSPSNSSSSSTATGSTSSKISSKSLKSQNTNANANRLSYPREFKLMVIEQYHTTNKQNKYRTCKQFHITKSMLNGWLQKAEKIHSSRPGSLKSGRSGRKPQFPGIEQQLYDLYFEQLGGSQRKKMDALEWSKCGKMTNKWIREKAKELALRECSEQQLQQGMCQFSERWLTNFKKRYGIQQKAECHIAGDLEPS